MVVVVVVGLVVVRLGVGVEDDRLDAGRSATGGARRLPAEIGSEEIPMRWLVSWLVAQVMAAASTIPSSAARAQPTV